MSLPTFIAIEAAADSEQSFPVSLAWSLPDGRIKQALIHPETSWQEDAEDSLAIVHELGLEWQGFTADEVVRELLYDQTDDVYYLARLHPQEGWLLKLFEAAGKDVTFELVEAAELYDSVEAWQASWQQALAFAGLDASRAEDQVRALLQVHVQLTGEAPEQLDADDEDY